MKPLTHPRLLLSVVLLSGLLTGLTGCDQRAYVILQLEDPDGVAAGAVAITYGAGPDGFARIELEGEGFPLSQTLVGEDGEERDLWVDALTADGAVMARAAVTITFDLERTGAATAIFGRPCEADTECEDDVFCNGVDRCISRVCAPGDDPCPASPFACVNAVCNEAVEACVLGPDHAQCQPLLDPATQQLEETYCDVRLGCVPGEGCDVEGDPCPRNSACEWNRSCVSGRCLPTSPLALDDDNPCTVDYCDEIDGPTHAASPFANGNTCSVTGGGLGICLQGECVVSSCGDDFLDRDQGEECDTGTERSDTVANACRMDCSLPTCGDGVADFGEPCDDGNLVDGDACLTGCILNVCGDGIQNPTAEACDDGNTDNTDTCVAGCLDASCGDGFVEAGQEECDDGNASEQDACLTTCVANICGDGFQNPLAEACDDGNALDTDFCVAGCVAADCGDGFVLAGVEDCDDANADETDSCISTCSFNVCGDGHVETGVEDCDDGNSSQQDACLSDCTDNVCGDGFQNPLAEACDDGNTDDTDACVTGCLNASCGDGFVEAGVEDCDDANGVSTDDCLVTCQANVCGDGIENVGVELCEDGNNANFDGCADDCDFVSWETDLGNPIGEVVLISWLTGVSPFTYGLGIGTTAGTFYNLSSVDGSITWSYDAGAPIQATAMADGTRIVLLTTDGRIHSVLKTGPGAGNTPEWTFDLPTTSSAIGLGRQQGGIVAVDDAGTISGVNSSGAAIALLNGYSLANNLGTCAGCAPAIPTHNNPAHGVILALDETVVVADFERPACPPMAYSLQPGERVRGEVAFLGDNGIGVSPRDKAWFVTNLNRVLQGSYFQPDAACAGGSVNIDWSWASGTSGLSSPVVIGRASTASAPDVRAIVFGGSDGLLHRINITDMPAGSPAWSYDLGAAVAGAAAVGNGHVYAGGADGRIHKVDAATGTRVWTVPITGGGVSGSPLLAGGSVFVSTSSGRIAALERGDDRTGDDVNAWHRQRASNVGHGVGSACATVGGNSRTTTGFLLSLGLLLVFRRRRSKL